MMFPRCSGACPPRPELGPQHQRRRQPPAARPHLRQPQLRRRGGGHLQARVPGQLSSYTGCYTRRVLLFVGQELQLKSLRL